LVVSLMNGAPGSSSTVRVDHTGSNISHVVRPSSTRQCLFARVRPHRSSRSCYLARACRELLWAERSVAPHRARPREASLLKGWRY
jgi:hypothetical protein